MVVGNGQLAQVFKNSSLEDGCIFASGVSNSSCVDIHEFERESKLLMLHLEKNKDKKFVYFSSCALSAKDYPKNAYYRHKENMENMIKTYSTNYYILRLPQLFGNLILHKTLINYLYKCLVHDHYFNVYSDAHRYVIEIHDVKKIVESYLSFSQSCIVVDIANPYRYSVLDIVNILEQLLQKNAKYSIIEKTDKYILEFEDMKKFIQQCKVSVDFNENYLFNHLKKILG